MRLLIKLSRLVAPRNFEDMKIVCIRMDLKNYLKRKERLVLADVSGGRRSRNRLPCYVLRGCALLQVWRSQSFTGSWSWNDPITIYRRTTRQRIQVQVTWGTQSKRQLDCGKTASTQWIQNPGQGICWELSFSVNFRCNCISRKTWPLLYKRSELPSEARAVQTMWTKAIPPTLWVPCKRGKVSQLFDARTLLQKVQS